MAIKTIRVFQEFTSAGYVPMPVAGNIDYGVTIAGTFPGTTPTTFQTDDPDIDVTLTATTDYYVWIRSHGTDWNPMYTRNVRVYPDSPLINNVVMGIIIANLDGTVPYVGATANVDLGEFGLKAGYLGLDLTPTATPTTVGTMSWNDAEGTMDLKLKGGNVTLQVGQEQVTRIVNKTGVNLLEANYQAVRISGAQGNRLKVDLAQANLDANSAETLGLVTETINNNAEGFITTSGLVRKIDTTGALQSETWADGDILYLSGTTAGRITNIKPQAPIHTVIMGYVVRAHQTQGEIYVKVDNGYELDELHNVKIVGALNKDVLVYNSTTKVWENRIIFKTQGYVPFYDDTLLLNNSPLYTNGNNVAIGSLTLTEKLVVGGNVLANQFKKVGGLSTEFLKADGSSDATAYQPLSADLTAIDNLALTTGLLRKNGLNTWELDQTEYLSVPIAISTYQTLANLSSNLTASTTKYPSVNAVNAGLALKLNLTGGTLTGGLTLNYSYPNIALSDVSSGTTWNILNDGGTYKLNYGATNNFYIFSSGNAAFVNSLTASSLIKSGGTSTQFLKADGSVDNTNYQPYDADLASIAGLELTTGLLRKNGLNTYTLDQTEYVALSTANSTYQTLANLQSNLTASSTKYPSVNAVNTGLNLKLNLSGGTLSGDLAISSSIPTLQLSDTSSGTIWNIQNDGGGLEFNSGITNKFVMYSSGNATFVNDLTANKFIKSGGTSSQFLMADGSVSSGNAGTVTSVGLSAPTGFSVSNSPITTSGTLALAFSAGYSLPSDATQATWTAKQNALNGTGFVKISGTTISYDNSTYYLASNPSGFTSNVGTVTSVAMSVPTGLSISGTPITTSGTLALSLTAGYSIPTTSSQGTWDTAYNRSLTSIGVSGTTTKTLTLTKQDGTTLTASWSDINTDAVTSVFGRTGAIVATSGDYTTAQVTESGNLYYLDSRAKASISGGTGISYNSTTGVITNTITQYTDALARASLSFVAGSGAYNSTTGVITIPTNNNQIANGAGYITGITSGMVTTALGYTPVTNARQLTINGTTYDLSADRSWTISGTIGGLTSGFIPKATSASTLGNSLIYDNGTNVGINTTSLYAKLQVNGSGAGYQDVLILENTNAASADLGTALTFAGVGTAAQTVIRSAWNGASTSNAYMAFLTKGSGSVTERMRLTSGGNLLVGTTTDSGEKLFVSGSGRFVNQLRAYNLLSDNQIKGSSYVELSPDQSTYNAWNIRVGAQAADACYYITGGGVNILTTEGYNNPYTVKLYSNGVQTLTMTNGVSTFGSSVNIATSTGTSLVYSLTPTGWNGAKHRLTVPTSGNTSMWSWNWNGSARDYASYGSSNIQLTDNVITFSNGTGNPSEVARFNGTSLLIGTTTDSGYKLDVNGTGRFSERLQLRGGGAGATQGGLLINYVGNVNSRSWILNNDYNVFGDFAILQSTTQTGSTYTAPFYIKNDGNVGIGEILPSEGKLVINNPSGSTNSGVSGNTLYLKAQTANANLIRFSGAIATDLIVGRFGNYDGISIGTTGGTEIARFLSNGNVGIGTTSPSLESGGAGINIVNSSYTQLRVESSSSSAGIEFKPATGTRYEIQSNTSSQWFVYDRTNAAYRLLINSSGNVGIGTTTPTFKFVVSKGGAEGMEFDVGTLIAGRNFLINYNRSTSTYTDFQIDANNIMFGTVGTERMRITAGGGVEISQNNASQPLFYAKQTGSSGYTAIQFSGNNGTDIGALTTYNGNIYFGSWNGGNGSSGQLLINKTTGAATFSSDITIAAAGQLYLTSGDLRYSSNAGFGIVSANGNRLVSIQNGAFGVTGAATFSSSVSASSFFETSDKTLKTLLVDNYQAKGIESIVAKLYTKNGKEELGYFAQDVQGILPSAVSKSSDGLLNLSYREVLVAKVQSLEQRVKQLETQLNLG